MTKLEEQLEKLGYRPSIFENRYIKYYKGTYNYILIQLSKSNNSIASYSLGSQKAFTNQQDIDNLQESFNQLQADLEVLKQCQD